MKVSSMYPYNMVLAVAPTDGITITIPRVIKERLDKVLEYYGEILVPGRRDARGVISVSYTELFTYILDKEEDSRAVHDGQN